MDRNQTIASCLSGVSGFVDTAGFVLLFGLFTAHVTGNFVLAGVAFALENRAEIWGRLGTLPVFALAVLLSAWISRTAKAQEQNGLAVLLLVEAAFLAAFEAAGILAGAGLHGGPSNPLVFVIGCLGVVAMGMQNGLMRVSLPSLAPTTVMTGNLTQATLDLLDFLAASDDAKGAIRVKLARTVPALCGFGAGAILGGITTAFVHFWSLTLPLFVLVALAHWVRQAQPNSKDPQFAATQPKTL